MTNENKRNVTVAAALLLLLAGAATWWFWPKKSDLPDDKPSAVATTSVPGMPGITFRVGEALKVDDKMMEDIKRDMLQSRIDTMRAYGKMTPAEKEKKLDEDIDQMEKMRKLMPTSMPSTFPSDGKPDVKIEDNGNVHKVSIRIGGGGQKAAIEDLPADVRAIASEYQKDVNARRAARGLPPGNGGTVIIRGGSTIIK